MSARRRLLGFGAYMSIAVGASLALPASGLAHTGYGLAPASHLGEPCAAEPCGDGQLKHPWGVAVYEATGEVYVVDRENDRVQVFNRQGKYMSQFDGSGTLPGEGQAAGSGGLPNELPTGKFERPSVIAVDNASGAASGDVYVADEHHGVVDVYSASGKYIAQLTNSGSAFEEFLGLATDASGNVLVYSQPGEIFEFDESGALVSKFTTGRGGAECLAVDAKGDIYACVPGAVVKFSSEGKVIGEWSNAGAVRAVAVDASSQNVFFGQEASIAKLPPDAEPGAEALEVFATSGLESSRGIAVDGATGEVYATSLTNGTVGVYKYGTLAEDSTGAATEVGSTLATVSGTVTRGAAPATYYVEYGQTTGYGARTPTVPVAGEAEEEVTTRLEGLFPNTTYHYRLVVENETGPVYGADAELTTAIAPSVVTDGPPVVSDATRTSALITGTVNDGHSSASYHIEFVSAGGYRPGAADPYANGASSPVIELQPADGDHTVGPVPLTGLLAGTIYHYRLVATNIAGTVYGPDNTFTTASGTPPQVTTGAPGEITQTGVLLTGTVDTSELQTSYEFEVGTTSAYEGAKLFGNAGANGSEAVSTSLQYLIPGMTYHYRLVATNADGTTYGQDMTFTTPGVASPIAQPPALAMVVSPSVAFPSTAGAITTAKGSGKHSKRKRKPRKKTSGKKHGKGKRATRTHG